MNYPASTPAEIQSVIKSQRKRRGLSQAEAGKLIGVSQNRIARLEAVPERARFEQISRLVASLGGRIVVEIPDGPAAPERPAVEPHTPW